MTPADFELERFFAKHEFAVKHLMCASDCESMSVRELLALEPGATERLLDQRLGYSESPGSPELREAICGLYTATKPEHVLAFTGAQEPIFAFMNVALRPSDDVIVHVPCYQSLHEVARAAGANVIPWEAREADAWQPDVDALKSLVTPRTKCIVVNSPHNPTGALLSRDRFDALIVFARERGLWLFSDEVYRGLEADPATRNPAACDVYERAVSLGTTAKTYGLAGLRIGWLAGHDAALFERLAAFKDYTTICNAGPSELLSALALRHAETLAGRCREIIAGNVKRFDAFARAHEIEWVPPRAGSIAFARKAGAPAWCEALLTYKGVLFAPGRLFGHTRDGDHFRVGLGRTTFAAGLAAI